jgi:hypothetical protein
MNSYSIRIEAKRGEVGEILDEMAKAQDTIRKCYSRLEDIGVIKFVEDASTTADWL